MINNELKGNQFSSISAAQQQIGNNSLERPRKQNPKGAHFHPFPATSGAFCCAQI